MQIVIAGIAGYADALGVAVLQALGGRAPVDFAPLTLVSALAAVILLFLAYAAAVRAAGPGALRWSAPGN